MSLRGLKFEISIGFATIMASDDFEIIFPEFVKFKVEYTSMIVSYQGKFVV